MKKLPISLFLLLLIASSNAQDKTEKSIRFGANMAFFGAGDLYGLGVYSEYAHPLNKYFSVVPRLMGAYTERKSVEQFDHIVSLVASASIRYTPLPRAYPGFKFDIGVLRQKFVNIYGTKTLNSDGDFVSENAYYDNESYFGLLGSLSFTFLNRPKYEAGFRCELLTGFYDGLLNADSYQLGVYYGMKF